MKKLEDAANNTKSWKHKVAEHEGLLKLIQPGNSSTLDLCECLRHKSESMPSHLESNCTLFDLIRLL